MTASLGPKHGALHRLNQLPFIVITRSRLITSLRGATLPLFAVAFGLMHALQLYWLSPTLEGEPLYLGGHYQLSSALLTLIAPTVCVSTFTHDQAIGRVSVALLTRLSPAQLTLGYALAATALCALCLLGALSALLPLSLITPLPWGELSSAYSGLTLMSALFVSLSLWASASTSKPMSAWLRAWLLCLLTSSLEVISELGPSSTRWAIAQLGSTPHLERTLRGVLDVKDVLYFVLGAALSIYFASQSLSTRYAPPSVTYSS